MRKKFFLCVLLSLVVQSSFAQSKRRAMFLQLKRIDKKIMLISESNISFLNKNKLNRHTIKFGASSVSYIEIQNKYVDSNFFRKYIDFAYKQSCSTVNRNRDAFYNFRFNGCTYLLIPCKVCSDYYNDDCFRLKKVVMKYFKVNKIEMLKF
jgi:hypothetical protein